MAGPVVEEEVQAVGVEEEAVEDVGVAVVEAVN
jgi:hypothetical protein